MHIRAANIVHLSIVVVLGLLWRTVHCFMWHFVSPANCVEPPDDTGLGWPCFAPRGDQSMDIVVVRKKASRRGYLQRRCAPVEVMSSCLLRALAGNMENLPPPPTSWKAREIGSDRADAQLGTNRGEGNESRDASRDRSTTRRFSKLRGEQRDSLSSPHGEALSVTSSDASCANSLQSYCRGRFRGFYARCQHASAVAALRVACPIMPGHFVNSYIKCYPPLSGYSAWSGVECQHNAYKRNLPNML